MSGRDAPTRIFLDPRVLHSVQTEEEEGLVGYIRHDFHVQTVNKLRQSEFVIQFEINQDDQILGLTNRGRMVYLERGKWIDLEAPGT